MKYCSTRGQESGLSFRDVLFAGYARDKGLYVPEEVPRLSAEELKQFSSLSYPDLVHAITRKFIDEEEIPDEDLSEIIKKSLTKFKYPEIIRVERLSGGLNIVELFHGATLAFKDLALSVVSGLLDYFLSKSGNHITVLIGTSGDTGSAAIEGVRGREHMDVVVLLPHGRCTHIQELMMTTVIEDNVHVYCVDGTSDDLDEPIKRCFEDGEFVHRHNLISINSINWGRILVQVAHYFFTYYQLCGQVGQPVTIVVPTGAAGNITAGCIAQKMGLPITLVAGVNTNDIVARTLSKGDFSMKAGVVPSLAPAMDIQVPYNVERLLYLYSGGDTAQVRKLMDSFESKNKVDIPECIQNNLKNAVTESFVVSDEEITATMARVHKEHQYILCPHTAVAAAYHYQRPSLGIPRGYIATASPAKFPEALQGAGIAPVVEGVAHLDTLPTRCLWMRKGEDWYTMLRAKIEAITSTRKTG